MNTFNNPLTEYSPQMESFEFSQNEEEFEGESGGVFNENEELELTAQLLEVNTEQELDHFLGDLISRAGSAVGRFARSSAGQAIGGVLKTIAKKALPVAGGALGGFFGGPLGSRIGSGLASMAGDALGLELEGLSQEDREFEATRQFVRFAGEAAKNALSAPQDNETVSMESAVSAAAEAARKHAPGLLSGILGGTNSRSNGGHKSHSGRWIRRGSNIVILGI